MIYFEYKIKINEKKDNELIIEYAKLVGPMVARKLIYSP